MGSQAQLCPTAPRLQAVNYPQLVLLEATIWLLVSLSLLTNLCMAALRRVSMQAPITRNGRCSTDGPRSFGQFACVGFTDRHFQGQLMLWDQVLVISTSGSVVIDQVTVLWLLGTCHTSNSGSHMCSYSIGPTSMWMLSYNCHLRGPCYS